MYRWIGAIAAIVACSEYGLDPANDAADDPSSAPGDATGGDDGWSEVDGEHCNGLDDDGDGLVDEGFPDTDGDGLVDCLDDDCAVTELAAGSCAVDASCTADLGDPHTPWSATIEWQWSGGDVLATPVIGNLTDDDGDGRVDHRDVPDVVVVTGDGELVALDGATGEPWWTLPGWLGRGGLALADVDQDGVTDVIGFDPTGHPQVATAAGQMRWRASRAVKTPYPQAAAADLDGDSRPEVLADTLILDGPTGQVVHELPAPLDTPYRMPSIGDLDLDGRQEVVLGATAFASDGTPLWTSDAHGSYGLWSALVQADDDPEAEVAFVGGGALVVVEHDGTERLRVAAPAHRPGAPCVADFDGDGVSEIGWASDSTLSVYELDGAHHWSVLVDDSSGLAACSGFDFDADGTYELVYADQHTLTVRDGLTGAAHLSFDGHRSATLWEYPSVADVDLDGSAEVVVASNGTGGWRGVTVLGHPTDGWPPSGSTWHTHDFAVTNVNPDGTVPAWPEPPWQAHGLVRARPPTDDPGVDLQVAIADVCWAGCADDAEAELAVVAFNTGTSPSRPSVPIALYGVYGDSMELVAVERVAERIGSGRTAASVTFRVQVGDAGPDGFWVRVDDTGLGGEVQIECDETNNSDIWVDTPC